MLRVTLASTLLAAGILGGCSSDPIAQTAAPTAIKQVGSVEQDRQTIRKLAGAFEINFNFRETVALQPGYKLHKMEETGAMELVLLISDQPNRLEFQHLLQDGDHVVKHWRETWTYEPKTILEYKGNRTWATRTLSDDERRGAWVQEVFEVSDQPRYAGIGKWNYAGEASRWESNETLRPLPRREYTTRSDYNLLLSRHSVQFTPAGWVHEQDSVKVIQKPDGSIDKSLARELALNTYNNTDAKDLQACVDYWKKTEGFWANVRGVWDATYKANPTFTLKDKVDEKPLFMFLFEASKKSNVPTTEIQSIVDRFVVSDKSVIAAR